jgi:hypothetical protein
VADNNFVAYIKEFDGAESWDASQKQLIVGSDSMVTHVNGGVLSVRFIAKVCKSAMNDIFVNTYNITGNTGYANEEPKRFSLETPKFKECRYFKTNNRQIWQILGGMSYEY